MQASNNQAAGKLDVLLPACCSAHDHGECRVVLTITHQLHGDYSATGHELSESIIESLPLVHCIKVLCLTKRQLAHLHVTAQHHVLEYVSLACLSEDYM